MSPQQRFEQALDGFAREAHPHLRKDAAHRGVVRACDVAALCAITGTDVPGLMVALLPVAAAFARTPVSGYAVGAVAAAAARRGPPGTPDLFLGANVEIPGDALGLTVHAEQSALVNAWASGAPPITSLAVSAPPCGHCRQFLRELASADTLDIVLPGTSAAPPQAITLGRLLPRAFGPQDLGVVGALMSGSAPAAELRLERMPGDEVVAAALDAARASYAPYTGGHAGCALQTACGRLLAGRYAENAAYNPSLSPLQVALSLLSLDVAAPQRRIARCALVEKAARVTQRPLTERLLSALAPSVALEYHRAE